jgi:hypothetical protein
MNATVNASPSNASTTTKRSVRVMRRPGRAPRAGAHGGPGRGKAPWPAQYRAEAPGRYRDMLS